MLCRKLCEGYYKHTKHTLQRSCCCVHGHFTVCRLFMGVYSSVISAAQEISLGQYVHYEDRWKDSVACKVAGVFSLMSCEVTVLIIFLLTLQHLILLCRPYSTYRFTKDSACGVTWLVGISVAAIPLFPGLSHWGHYGQTALCSLSLHNKRQLTLTFRFMHAI